ncbi:MAG: sigma-70 family RNA polymerase sigma factor [Acidobacteria bacterium]|nr:sigma-70 family RNA polymerase sigma factor [Acidobacteriota bacterium]
MKFVRKIINGEANAEDQFAWKYLPRFTFIAYKRHIPPQDCQDVAQEALLRAVRQIQQHQYKGESSLGTWLDHIISGAIADYYRKLKKEPVQKLGRDGVPVSVDSISVPPLESIEDGLLIREAMRNLPSIYRIILMLKRTEGCTLEEISRMLGMTLGQVSNKFYAAQQMFRDQLEEMHELSQNSGKKLPQTPGRKMLEGEK